MPLIELNHQYSSTEVAQLLGISLKTLGNSREKYDAYLALFFQFTKEQRGKSHSFYYTFTHSYNENNELIPYKEYKKMQKNNAITKNIAQTIEKDNRQTGSNIARIICVNNEIIALNLKLTTLTTYVRSNLKELIAQGYYIKGDYKWCYLDKTEQVYKLMTNEEVAELRSYFKISNDEAEDLHARYKEGDYNLKEYHTKLGEIVNAQFEQGIYKYYSIHNYYPMKVPTYTPNTFYTKEINKLLLTTTY